MSDKRWIPETYKCSFKNIVGFCTQPGWLYPLKFIEAPPGKVLEVGCGSGKWSALFALIGFQVTCTDTDPMMLQQVRTNFPNIKMRYKVATLPYISDQFAEQFDVVFNEGTIEHFLNNTARLRAIEDMIKCLRPGGVFFLIVPYYPHSNPPEDEFKYTPDILKAEVAVFITSRPPDTWVLKEVDGDRHFLGVIIKK